jgi:hypothetical protein
LTALLSKTLDALSREVDDDRDEGMPRLAVWATVVQHLDEQGVDERDLPRLARLSKRALPPALKPLQRAGHIAITDKRVRLTPAGRAASDAWPPLLADAERRWRRRFGAARMTSLRRSLEQLASGFELHHPDYPTRYGPADPTVRGGPGKDWKPVPRPPGASTGAPLTSLLSQALVELTADYDGRAGPLAWAANVLRFIPGGDVAVAELSDGGWVPTMARHGFVELSSDRSRVALTPLSRRMRDAYLPVLATIEDEWSTRYGREVVDALRSALEAIVAVVDPDDQLAHLHSFAALWSDARWGAQVAT